MDLVVHATCSIQRYAAARPELANCTLQMGGAEGVHTAEHMAMTLQPGGGLRMLLTRREAMG